MSQLQIPQEHYVIGRALRGCQYRNAIGLANPIFGATRRKLAEAYRERPAIVHFAGHGTERSLSILEDHGVTANAIPLGSDDLCAMLRTIEGRVRLCVLNTCDSDGVARHIVDAGVVDWAVGWRGRVSDSAAIAFSEALYGALGDGRRVVDAVKVATVVCGPGSTPVLFPEGLDTDAVIVGGAEAQ